MEAESHLICLRKFSTLTNSNNKALLQKQQGFFFVAERNGISNHNLYKDIDRMENLSEFQDRRNQLVFFYKWGVLNLFFYKFHSVKRPQHYIPFRFCCQQQ